MISKEEAHLLQKLTPLNTAADKTVAHLFFGKKSICRNANNRQSLKVYILDDFDNEVVYPKMIL
ncbi:hypothetical protein FW781_14330 [Chryseobacterium panacisoli]|uniref:Uncharacterized protein n=1 Tax=Chryseobacterium panacisoli TaxID=1807141 RepID=A0A5D8ZJB9_9FLAO|nr:hypothetical protein [Chryseobacterium panacisoli]TZF95069.1 hypothetical protein FW781_14330 [Chryseobacterium panacisoli]